jgi:hypothetical protein
MVKKISLSVQEGSSNASGSAAIALFNWKLSGFWLLKWNHW